MYGLRLEKFGVKRELNKQVWRGFWVFLDKIGERFFWEFSAKLVKKQEKIIPKLEKISTIKYWLSKIYYKKMKNTLFVWICILKLIFLHKILLF